MNKRFTVIKIITILLTGMLTVTFNTTLVSGEENNAIVMVYHDRTRIYYADLFEDTIYNHRLNGYRLRSYYIRPQEGATVSDAQIVMETQFSQGDFVWINPTGYKYSTGTPPYPYKYEWNFGTISPFGQAAVWIHTPFPVTFRPGYEIKRKWDFDLITSPSVTQTLKITFFPYLSFINVHIHVGADPTPDVSAKIVLESASTDWLVSESSGGVDWQIPYYDLSPGRKYTFTVDIEVNNGLYPAPVFYKPSVGIGANIELSHNTESSTDQVTVSDDMNGNGGTDSKVTYMGEEGELFDWEVIVQRENSVSLPSYGRGFPYTKAEGRSFIRLEDGFIRGPATFRICKSPNTVSLVFEGDEPDFGWLITKYSKRGTCTILECEPDPESPDTRYPMRVVISKLKENRWVSASGRGFNFNGDILEIKWLP